MLFTLVRPLLVGFLMMLSCSSFTYAEQVVIRIRILDGRIGKPLIGAQGAISLIENYSLQNRQISPSGDEYLVKVPADTTMNLASVRIGSSRWYDFKPCVKNELIRPIFAVSDILKTGVVAPNTCSQKVFSNAKAGVIVFFIQPLSWTDKLKYWANGFKD